MEKIKKCANVCAKYGVDILLVISVVCLLGVNVWKIRTLSYETAKLKCELEVTKSDLKGLEDNEALTGKLKLKCADKTLNFGSINGIKKENWQFLEVKSPYTVTLYQVIGKEGEVLQNNSLENEKSNAKIKTFKIEGVTEEVTQIRLFGFNENKDQVASQIYDIVFLE